MKKLFLSAFLLLGLAVFAAKPNFSPTVTLSPNPFTSNTVLTYSGSGWAPNSSVFITIEGAPFTLGEPTDSNGNWWSATQFQIDPGTYNFVVVQTLHNHKTLTASTELIVQ